MKQIISDFVNGSSTEKLSIISNLSTILGVSVATFVAGPFLSQFANKEFVVSDFIIAIVFYFLFIWLSLFVVYSTVKEMYTFFKDGAYGKFLGDGVLLLLVFWVFVVSFPYIKYAVGNAFNVSYLLAPPAFQTVKGISNVEVRDKDNVMIVSGVIEAEKGTVFSDYEVLLYAKDDQATYKITRLTNREYTSEVSSKGNFVLPVSASQNELEDIYLVVVRTSDWSFIESIGIGSSGYPTGMTYIPDSSLEKLKAYIYRIET
ncbi:hypothetical protein B7489_18505 [Vibrio alginolyticus]|uniref:hypothetical protein n=1 Tax=Vibrio alginolyticus TaxID=663 RepID=UPI000A1FADF8|nr:hypothetical protein [Vibrio alginolyticus]OSP11392.1 hypothetical protein B7489_18505 [Vibrio alginolyticus]